MLDQELTDAIAHLVGMFPRMDQNEILMQDWARKLKQFPLATVREAISLHREECRFHNPDQRAILAKCRVMRTGERDSGKPHGDGIADEIRRSHPWLAGETSDAAVILRKYRQDWVEYIGRLNRRVSGTPADKLADERHRAAITQRACIRRAHYSLIAIGATYKAAKAWAGAILLGPDDFRFSLDDLRDNGIEMDQTPQKQVEQAFNAFDLLSFDPEPQTPHEAIKQLAMAG